MQLKKDCISHNTDETQMHYAMWKKPEFKNHVLYHSVYRTFFKRQNHGDGEQVTGCHGLGVWVELTAYG